MPKLSSAMAEKVDEAESGDFEALPEGIYTAILEGEVEAVDGAKGPYWKWVFKITGDSSGGDEGKGRKMFLNTSLNEAAHWKLKEVFEAFGVPLTTDTDELIGESVKLYLVQKVAEKGKREGDMVNEIKNVYPVNQGTADAVSGGTSKPKAKKPGAQDVVPLF